MTSHRSCCNTWGMITFGMLHCKGFAFFPVKGLETIQLNRILLTIYAMSFRMICTCPVREIQELTYAHDLLLATKICVRDEITTVYLTF